MPLITTLVALFILLACPLIVEFFLTGIVSGRGALGSMILVIGFTCWHVITCRRKEIQARIDARLRRSALLRQHERGESEWREMVWLLLALSSFAALLAIFGGAR